MQEKNLNISDAPMPPRRAEPRYTRTHDAEGHVRGVEANSGGLIRATLGSAVAAGAILVFFWLPAEYGIDATGLGQVMGLTQMGEIKQQLYAEAAAEDAALTAQPVASAQAAPASDPEVLQRLSAIETQLAAIASIVGATPEKAPVEDGITAEGAAQAAPEWRDEISYTLEPTEGIEVKLVMQEGDVAEFEWTANGSVLNYDTHGDGSGQRISYEQGRGVPDQAGELVASFTGNHGWFWRNRTEAPVTVTLRTRGDYVEMRAP